VLLLDEPLSALDLKLRHHMRNELRAIQRRVGITFIYITHDQGEALTMSDRVAVMNKGVIEQVADGRTLYETPRTSFVASFVGENNAFIGTVAETDGDLAQVASPTGVLSGRNLRKLRRSSEAVLFVRPEALFVDAEGPLAARTGEVAYEGSQTHAAFTLNDGGIVTVTFGRGETVPEPGSHVRLGFAPEDAIVLPREGYADA
jgi:spermidine/putrescine transport system ATP-binding protein